MTSFRALSDDQRWALAFYVANMGRPEADVRRGAELWQAGRGRQALPDLASVATQSAREVEAKHGADTVALLTYLRTRPDVFATSGKHGHHDERAPATREPGGVPPGPLPPSAGPRSVELS